MYALARERNGEDVVLDLNGVPMLVLQRHESADQVLRLRAAQYRKNMAWLRQTLGASRFTEEGDAWQARRRLTHAYFTHFDRGRTCDLAGRHGQLALRRMLDDSAAGAAAIDDDVLRRLTLSVLVENFLEIPFPATGFDMALITEMMEYGSAYAFVPPGRTGDFYQQGLRRLPALRREIMRQMRVLRDGHLPVNPLLAGMLAADAEPGSGIVLEHELITFFAAGAESSASSLGWACYLLARHPEAQERLREEVLRLDPAAGWPALSRCAPLADFVSEVLRLFPSTPIVTRQATVADRIGAHEVAAGQNVMVSLIGIGHDRRAASDPWALAAPGAVRGPCGGTRMAFSIGPYICGGKLFALVELMAVVAGFLRQARFELTSSALPRFHWKVQMLREGGQPVRVVPWSCAVD
nr:cytochrome P450 [Stenotrophomonas mori]